MDKLDKFLGFLVENRESDSVEVIKQMKHGHRFYYIYVDIEKEEDSNNTSYFRDRLVVTIDTRNQCVVLENDYSDGNILIESEEMVKKWSDIIEKSLAESIDSRLESLIDKTINGFTSELNREFKLKKIFE